MAKTVLGFQLGNVLGRGGFGFVKEATHGGHTYAMKILTKGSKGWNKQEEEMVRTEIEIMSQLNHPNVVRVISHEMNGTYPREDGNDEECVIIVMELAQGGNLFDILYFTDGFDETITRTYLKQLVGALGAMHGLGIAHRDIKPQNTLLDGQFNVKICDFGLSKKVDGGSLMQTKLGTRPFQAPEILMNREYDYGVDVFALGVCYFLMLTGGVPPFKEATVNDKWFKCIAGKAEDKFWKRHKAAKKKVEATCGDGFANAVALFFWMCAYQPTERATITDCAKHAWFTGPKTEGEALKTTMKAIVDKAMEAKRNDPEMSGEISEKVRAICLAELDMDAQAPEDPSRFLPNFTYEIIEEHPYVVFKSLEDLLFKYGVAKNATEFDPETFTLKVKVEFADKAEQSLTIQAYREEQTNYMVFKKDDAFGFATNANMLITKLIDRHVQQLGALKHQEEVVHAPLDEERIKSIQQHMANLAAARAEN